MKKSNHPRTILNHLFISLLIAGLAGFTACGDGGGTGPTPPGNNEPSISSISPTEGAIGSEVTINGRHFSAVKSENTVEFGSTEAAINSASETKLNVTVPEGLQIDSNYEVTETVDDETATASVKFAVSSPPDTADAVPQDGVLEAVTWNLLFFGYPNDGPSNEELQLNNDVIIVDSLNADLFAFQEIKSDDAIQKLAGRMKGYQAIFDETSNQGNAFVYNTNAIEPISSGDIDMGQTSQPWAGRIPFYFEFNYKPGNGAPKVDIYAVVIHAKAGAGQDDYNRRKEAAQELYDYLTNQKPDAKIILMGDFNDETNISIYNDQPSPYIPFVDDKTHYNVLTFDLSESGKTSETGYNSVIDNIIISNEMVNLYQEGSTKVFMPDFINNYGNTTSDHYPVEATFDMTK